MIAPSLVTAGNVGFDEEPNALLFETVQLSLGSARTTIPGQAHESRPWLQEFTC